MRAGISLLAALAALLAAPPAAAQATLNAEVSGALTIFLRQGDADVAHLQPGGYAVNVNDASDQHNFGLTGPGGLELRTDGRSAGLGGLTFDPGVYHFNCEHHAQMFGDLRSAT